jgi:hypothetical protein
MPYDYPSSLAISHQLFGKLQTKDESALLSCVMLHDMIETRFFGEVQTHENLYLKNLIWSSACAYSP